MPSLIVIGSNTGSFASVPTLLDGVIERPLEYAWKAVVLVYVAVVCINFYRRRFKPLKTAP